MKQFMKTFLIIILLTIFAKAQSTYDVGQSNANTSSALAVSLAQLDSNIIFRGELNALSSGKQTADADLTTYAGITPSANIQTFLGAATYAAMKTQLALTIGTNVQAYDADLTTYAGITPSANVQTFLGYADFAAMRVGLGLVIGTNVQAYDADLTSWAAITPAIYYDTLAVGFGMGGGNTEIDTITVGAYAGWKVPNNITVTEVAAYTNTGTVTFNLEERAETTPNTAGTDVMTSDLVGDTNQQETGTFSNAGIARNAWLVLTVTSITGDPTIFSATIRFIKTN